MLICALSAHVKEHKVKFCLGNCVNLFFLRLKIIVNKLSNNIMFYTRKKKTLLPPSLIIRFF